MTATIKRFTLAAAAGIVAISLAGGAYAAGQDNAPQGPGPGGRGGRFGGPGGPMGPGGPGGPRGMLPLRQLDLTDAQRERVKAIAESHKEEDAALRERARKAHAALQAAITGDTFDEATVRTKAADVATVEADMAVAQARQFTEVYQILTSEQQAKLKEHQANMQKRLADGRRRGPGRR